MPKNENGLSITSNQKTYEAVVKEDSLQRMISLKTLIPTLLFDLRYAGYNNFIGKPLYPIDLTDSYLRLLPAHSLLKVQQALALKGLGLKIFDAYRPFSVTKTFWNLVHDERYVANPLKGSGHNKGVAVDLTIIDLKSKLQLNMGTDFDNFTDSAHITFTNFPASILNNRKLLQTIMEANGFKVLETEWWHFSWPNLEGKYQILDIDFKSFAKE